MNKYISIGVVVVVLALGVWLIVKGHKPADTVSNPDVATQDQQQAGEANPATPANTDADKNITNQPKKQMTKATLKTNMGDITFEFYNNDSPKTVANFEKLAGEGFYNGIRFHRVIKGFMIQGGDPQSKDDAKVALWGTGGPGYKFDDEINANSDLYTKIGYKKGIVAMANSGPNTNGSQFFIMNADNALPPLYTIFGKVVLGQEVVDKIAEVKTGASDRPVSPVTINSVVLE